MLFDLHMMIRGPQRKGLYLHKEELQTGWDKLELVSSWEKLNCLGRCMSRCLFEAYHL